MRCGRVRARHHLLARTTWSQREDINTNTNTHTHETTKVDVAAKTKLVVLYHLKEFF